MKLTPENAKAVIPLLQAVAEGKTLQMRSYGQGWQDMNDKDGEYTIYSFCEYRIKPEPRVVWVNETSGNPSCWDVYDNEEDAKRFGRDTIGVVRTAVRYVEDTTNGK